MSKYPLCESLGVKVEHGAIDSIKVRGSAIMCEKEWRDYVHAADLEAALAKAPVVRSDEKDDSPEQMAWYPSRFKTSEVTHTARLVCVEAIAKDTAESLLREMLKWWTDPEDGSDANPLIERARRLLGEGK